MRSDQDLFKTIEHESISAKISAIEYTLPSHISTPHSQYGSGSVSRRAKSMGPFRDLDAEPGFSDKIILPIGIPIKCLGRGQFFLAIGQRSISTVLSQSGN
jgi:hypothetical protein